MKNTRGEPSAGGQTAPRETSLSSCLFIPCRSLHCGTRCKHSNYVLAFFYFYKYKSKNFLVSLPRTPTLRRNYQNPHKLPENRTHLTRTLSLTEKRCAIKPLLDLKKGES